MLNELGLPVRAHRLRRAQRPNTCSLTTCAFMPAAWSRPSRSGSSTCWNPSRIMMLLADRFPESGLAPPPDDLERPAYLQWMFYGAATLGGRGRKDHACGAQRHRSPIADELQHQLPIFDRYVIILEKMLENRDYLLTRGFSAADIAIGLELLRARTILGSSSSTRSSSATTIDSPSDRRSRPRSTGVRLLPEGRGLAGGGGLARTGRWRPEQLAGRTARASEAQPDIAVPGSSRR